MASTKRRRRSYSAGERGRNRVLVFPDPRTGLLQIEWREGGRRLTKSLGHRDWDRAKRQADAVAAGRVQPLTPVELRPLPSAPALQIPELLPSPALQSASSADAPRPAARPPLPLLVSFRPLREAQLAAAQPRRFPALRVDPVYDHVHVRVSAPVRHDQRLVLLQPQRFQALRRLPGLNSAAPAPHPWPSYRHMDAIWTPQQTASPYTTIELAVKYLLFMHLCSAPPGTRTPNLLIKSQLL